MSKTNKTIVPFALFNSKAVFNPYQYKPFFGIMEKGEEKWKWNGKNVFITDEVGVGKTFETGIILQELLENNSNLSVLIISPVKLCANWEKELRENFNLAFQNYRENKCFGRLTILPYSYFSGRNFTDIAEENEAEQDLQEEGKEEDIKYPEYDILVLDEAHYIRNGGNLHTYIENMIDKNERNEKKLKIFLTATPIFNSEKDYDNITNLLEKNKQEFVTTTTLQGEANCYDFELEINLKKVSLGEKEKEIIEEINEVDGEEGKKYGRSTGILNRIAASSIYSLDKCVNKESRGTFMKEEDIDISQLQELDKDNNDDSNKETLQNLCQEWKKSEDKKLLSLKNLLERLKKDVDKSKPFKAIIFSTFINTCNYLEEKLGNDYKTYKITGKTKAKELKNIVESFEYQEAPSILICSDAAKEGHNFQFCQYLIHYDFPYTPAAIGQRNGRIYRRGQEENPVVYYMFTEDSYDERLFGEIIVSKARIVKAFSKKNKVSILNVLPQNVLDDSKDGNNSNDFNFEDCVRKYFEEEVKKEKVKKEKVKKEKEDQEKEDQENNGLSPERRVLRRILKKQFYNHKEKVWSSEEIKDIYEKNEKNEADTLINIIFPDTEKKNEENLQKTDEQKNENNLQTFYKQKYNEELHGFLKKVFGEQCENGKENEKKFIEYCIDYIKQLVLENYVKK